MKSHQRTIKLVLIGVAILLAALFVFRQREDVVVVRASSGVQKISTHEAVDRLSNPFLSVATMAAFAANVYGPQPDDPVACADETGLIPIPEGWHKLGGEFYPLIEGSDESGFKYEHWAYPVFQDDPDSDDVYTVIVFAGTEGLDDWCANFRFVCAAKVDQYRQAVTAVSYVIDYSYDELVGPYLKPVAVGHSLGGGLAELAGLLHDKVHPVYAFDPSPVIGANAVQAEELDFEGIDWGSTFRIFDHGEALAYLRLIKRWLFGRADVLGETVEEYRFNLLSGNPIKQHSMRELACQLRQLEDSTADR